MKTKGAEKREGQVIRQAYAAFWKEWIILIIGVLLVAAPEAISAWVQSKTGAAAFDGIPLDTIILGAGFLAIGYALVFKIGYDLLANRYTLTSEEVVETYGIIQKNQKVTKLEHIRRVSVEIGIMGRILGYGDVLYFTSGSGGVDVRLNDIPNPEALAAEADQLAKQRKKEVEQEERQVRGTAGGGALPEGLLDALASALGESAAVQKEMLEEMRELRREFQHRQTPGQSDSWSAHEADREDSGSSDAMVSEGRTARFEDVGDEPVRNDEDLGDDYSSDAGWLEDSGESQPTPKMFEHWDDILSPESGGGDTEQVADKSPVSDIDNGNDGSPTETERKDELPAGQHKNELPGVKEIEETEFVGLTSRPRN